MEHPQEQAPQQLGREERFVRDVIQRCQQNKGLAARLRRADNAATEFQSWDFLASYEIDLENDYERLPFATIAAAIAKSKAERNGSLTLGRAIASCYEEGNQSDQAKARLRRILACHDLPELSRILRPVLDLVNSRVNRPLDYSRLLKQLRRFGFAGRSYDHQRLQRIKAEWAQEFYGHKEQAEVSP